MDSKITKSHVVSKHDNFSIGLHCCVHENVLFLDKKFFTLPNK
jgi:hypothetical protein